MKVVETAVALASLGYHVVPLQSRNKRPVDENFLDFRLTPNEVSKYFDTARNYNIGILLGTEVRPGAFLLAIDVDLDDDLLITRIKTAIPGEPAAKKGAKGVTFFTRTSTAVRSRDVFRKDPISKRRITAFNLLGVGKQTVIPPSIHPDTGSPYVWLSISLEDTPIESLPLVDEWCIYEMYLAATKPDSPWFLINDMAWHGVGKGGSVDDSLLRSTGAMVEAGCADEWIIARVQRAVDAMLRIHGRHDWSDDIYGRRLRNCINDARSKGFDKTGNKRENRILMMAEWLMGVHGGRSNLRQLQNGQIRKYDDGYWPALATKELENQIAWEFRLIGRDVDAVIHTVTKHVPEWPPFIPRRRIRLMNGTYDPSAQSFSADGDPDDYLLHRLPFDYDPDAVCLAYDAFIRRAFEQVNGVDGPDRTDEELKLDRDMSIQCFEEFVGLTFVEDLSYQKCLMVIGAPNTGKSTMMRLVRMLHHPSAVGASMVAKLAEERTRTAMVGKLVTFSPEVSSMSQVADDMFKAIIGGDEVPVRRLYEEETMAVIPARIVITGNDPFRFSDASGGIEKRLLYLRCDKRIPDDEIDRTLEDKLRAELPGIFNRMVAGLSRLYARGFFDPPPRSRDNVARLGEDNNPVRLFLADQTHQGLKLEDPKYEIPVNGDDGNLTESSQVYMRYAEWTKANGFKQMSVITFGLHMTRLGFPSVNKRLGSRVVKCRAVSFLNEHKNY